MAIFHLSMKIISRRRKQSVVAAIAYRAGEKIKCEMTGKIFDYSRKRHVDFSAIYLPSDAPPHMQDRSYLWNHVEKNEIRKDAQLAREVEFSLPIELTKEEQTELAEKFVLENFVSEGMIADIALHNLGGKNPHCHALLTLRSVGADGFGNKVREWNSPDLLLAWRRKWAAYANDALKEAGHDARIDHRTLEAQGIDRDPQIHEFRIPKLIQANRKIIALNEFRTKVEAERTRLANLSPLEEHIEARLEYNAATEAVTLLNEEENRLQQPNPSLDAVLARKKRATKRLKKTQSAHRKHMLERHKSSLFTDTTDTGDLTTSEISAPQNVDQPTTYKPLLLLYPTEPVNSQHTNNPVGGEQATQPVKTPDTAQNGAATEHATVPQPAALESTHPSGPDSEQPVQPAPTAKPEIGVEIKPEAAPSTGLELANLTPAQELAEATNEHRIARDATARVRMEVNALRETRWVTALLMDATLTPDEIAIRLADRKIQPYLNAIRDISKANDEAFEKWTKWAATNQANVSKAEQDIGPGASLWKTWVSAAAELDAARLEHDKAKTRLLSPPILKLATKNVIAQRLGAEARNKEAVIKLHGLQPTIDATNARLRAAAAQLKKARGTVQKKAATGSSTAPKLDAQPAPRSASTRDPQSEHLTPSPELPAMETAQQVRVPTTDPAVAPTQVEQPTTNTSLQLSCPAEPVNSEHTKNPVPVKKPISTQSRTVTEPKAVPMRLSNELEVAKSNLRRARAEAAQARDSIDSLREGLRETEMLIDDNITAEQIVHDQFFESTRFCIKEIGRASKVKYETLKKWNEWSAKNPADVVAAKHGFGRGANLWRLLELATDQLSNAKLQRDNTKSHMSDPVMLKLKVTIVAAQRRGAEAQHKEIKLSLTAMESVLHQIMARLRAAVAWVKKAKRAIAEESARKPVRAPDTTQKMARTKLETAVVPVSYAVNTTKSAIESQRQRPAPAPLQQAPLIEEAGCTTETETTLAADSAKAEAPNNQGQTEQPAPSAAQEQSGDTPVTTVPKKPTRPARNWDDDFTP